MKKYKFRIDKILEKQIEIEAKNNKQAVKKLAEFMSRKNKNNTRVLDKDNYCYINLKQISEGKNKIYFDEDDEINKDIIFNLFSANEFKIEKKKDENNTENLKEHIEVVCERCGNCILIDDIIHRLGL